MRLAPEPIEPIIKERDVALDIEQAFDLFTRRLGEWWPMATHSMGGSDTATMRFEATVGGRIVEVMEDGTEHIWAVVLAWDPPERLVVSWHPNPEPEAATTLEVRFQSVAEHTALRLEHRGWEEFGQLPGQALRNGYDPGWDAVLTSFTDSSTTQG